MIRHIVVFVVTFAIGAGIAVILRTGSRHPYAEHADHATPPMATAMAEAPPSSAVQAPPSAEPATAMAMPASAAPAPQPEHAEHEHDHGHAASPAAPAPPADATPVNTICAICGMPVDPALGTATYKGSVIGFGCKTCLPKFKADPAKYGEAALKNQVVE